MMMGSPGHPFHIYGTQFQILSLNGYELEENKKGWKDTKGMFMYHCHILEHEEAGTMGQLEVE